MTVPAALLAVPPAHLAAQAEGPPRLSRSRPIDLVHLARQTQGDLALETEVLGLMRRQIALFSARLGEAGEGERRQIAHALKGAARNVGAFPLADRAEAFERGPFDVVAFEGLTDEMHRTSAFIATLIA